jgi:hypothetical protein
MKGAQRDWGAWSELDAEGAESTWRIASGTLASLAANITIKDEWTGTLRAKLREQRRHVCAGNVGGWCSVCGARRDDQPRVVDQAAIP